MIENVDNPPSSEEDEVYDGEVEDEEDEDDSDGVLLGTQSEKAALPNLYRAEPEKISAKSAKIMAPSSVHTSSVVVALREEISSLRKMLRKHVRHDFGYDTAKARYPGICRVCFKTYFKGALITPHLQHYIWVHALCATRKMPKCIDCDINDGIWKVHLRNALRCTTCRPTAKPRSHDVANIHQPAYEELMEK